MPRVHFIMPTGRRVDLVRPRIVTEPHQVRLRLDIHKIALESQGVTDLSLLRTLSLSGIVTPSPGLLIPRSDDIVARQATFGSVIRVKPGGGAGSRELEKIGGITNILKAEAFPRPHHHRPPLLPTVHEISTAYWAADEIILEDDMQVVLMQPNRFLVIIANSISFGRNVSIGWAKTDKIIPKKEEKPTTPDPPAQSIYMAGTNGFRGDNGEDGGPGSDGDHGPEIGV